MRSLLIFALIFSLSAPDAPTGLVVDAPEPDTTISLVLSWDVTTIRRRMGLHQVREKKNSTVVAVHRELLYNLLP